MNRKNFFLLFLCHVSFLSAMDNPMDWLMQRYNDKLCQRFPWRIDAIKNGDFQLISIRNKVESYLECLQEAIINECLIDYSFFPEGVAFDDLIDCVIEQSEKRTLNCRILETFLSHAHKPREWMVEDGVEVPGNLHYALTAFNFEVAKLLQKYGAQVGEREREAMHKRT